MQDKTIILEGKAFPVPPLALGQIKIVVPLILKLKSMDMNAITAANMDDLAEICFVAAAKGTPSLTRAAFLDMHITVEEMLQAHVVIATQAGMVFAKGDASGEPIAGK